jgi:succinoglycan biosynthesis protein ExoM
MISVCICTFRRLEGITHTLESFKAVVAPDGVPLEIIVVDNDAAETARDSVRRAAAALDWPVRYFCEPRSGVTFARNRCVAESSGSLIAFIDDDEWCAPDWLVHLHQQMQDPRIDAVFGPVIPVFRTTPPAWLLGEGPHHRRRFATGTVIDWRQTRTSNVMFRRTLIDRFGGFSEAFSASGAEDTEFFSRLEAQGAVFVSSDEAVVFEDVPESRMRLGWLMKRALMGGRNYVRVRAVRDGAWLYAGFAGRGLVGLLAFSCLSMVCYPVSRAVSLRFVLRACGDFGKMSAFLAGNQGEYGH